MCGANGRCAVNPGHGEPLAVIAAPHPASPPPSHRTPTSWTPLRRPASTCEWPACALGHRSACSTMPSVSVLAPEHWRRRGPHLHAVSASKPARLNLVFPLPRRPYSCRAGECTTPAAGAGLRAMRPAQSPRLAVEQAYEHPCSAQRHLGSPQTGPLPVCWAGTARRPCGGSNVGNVCGQHVSDHAGAAAAGSRRRPCVGDLNVAHAHAYHLESGGARCAPALPSANQPPCSHAVPCLQVPAPAAPARWRLAPSTRATSPSWTTPRWATALC